MSTIRQCCFPSSGEYRATKQWHSLARDSMVSRMEPSSKILKSPLLITGIAIAIIVLCLFAVGVIISWLLVGGTIQLLGLCLITYPVLVAWQQYASVFRHSRKAAAVTAILGGVVGVPTTLLFLTMLPWYIKIAKKNPDTTDWTGFTVFVGIAITGVACVICNLIWYRQLKWAAAHGIAPKPSERFSLRELMWLVVAISFVMAVSSFWHRAFMVDF